MTLVFNWKSYLSIHESRELAAIIAEQASFLKEGDLIIAPSHLALHDVRYHLQGSTVKMATQGISQEPNLGAFTAQVPVQHLQSLDIDYAIIGHSEMRAYLGHTNSMISKQLSVCLASSITPIICIGETEEEKFAGRTEQVVVQQLQEMLSGQEIKPDRKVIIAYEPRWAIGTGKADTPENANHVHDLIKQASKDFKLNNLDVLYGGRMNPENIVVATTVHDERADVTRHGRPVNIRVHRAAPPDRIADEQQEPAK